MKKIVFILLVFIQLLYSCNNLSDKISNENKAIAKLDLLLGTWENIQDESEFYEIWRKENDSVFYGESFLLVSKDTVFFETILLEQIREDLFLTPTNKGQNDGNPVTFKLISNENNVFVFENKEHDFPQRIIYTNPTLDSLFAYIEGNENGKYRKTDFRFKRN